MENDHVGYDTLGNDTYGVVLYDHDDFAGLVHPVDHDALAGLLLYLSICINFHHEDHDAVAGLVLFRSIRINFHPVVLCYAIA